MKSCTPQFLAVLFAAVLSAVATPAAGQKTISKTVTGPAPGTPTAPAPTPPVRGRGAGAPLQLIGPVTGPTLPERLVNFATKTATAPGPQGLKITPRSPTVHEIFWMQDGVTLERFDVHRTSPSLGGQWQPVTFKPEEIYERNPYGVLKYSHTVLLETAYLPSNETHTYRVTYIYPDGREGWSDATYDPSPVQVPTAFTGHETFSGDVLLKWYDVWAASYYLVFGPGMPATGQRVNTTSLSIPNLPVGSHTFMVTAYYEPGIYAGGPQVSVRVVQLTTKYRILIGAIQVVSQTADDNKLHFDGKQDEIFLLTTAMLMDRRVEPWAVPRFARLDYPGFPGPPDNPLAVAMVSVVMGDVNNLPGRQQQGSASAAGGIQSGDWLGLLPGVPAGTPTLGLPYLVFEGSLTDSVQVLVIKPTVWEFDQHVSTLGTKFDAGSGPNEDMWYGNWHWPNALPLVNTINDAQIRLVGVAPYVGYFTGNRRIGPSLAFVLTREKLEALLAAPPSGGLMPGQFKVQFTEPDPGLSGDYILHFRVERVP